MPVLKIVIFIFAVICSSQVLGAEAPRSKLEELFIWKMSDELGLKPVEEKSFSDLVRDLNQKKADLNQQLQDHLEKMTAAKTEKVKAHELNQYKKTQKAYNHLSEEEIERIQKLLGVTRTAQYLQAKKDLTNRLKSLLVNPEAASGAKKSLPPPKVIEGP